MAGIMSAKACCTGRVRSSYQRGRALKRDPPNQIHLMKDFNATAIVGFGDYITYLAGVARKEGFEPGRDINIRVISGHMGAEAREAISSAWGGAEIYDWYGVGDTGAIAGEGPDHAGMYVHEDAQYLEILDVETGAVQPDGASGDMVVTCLYKDERISNHPL